MFANRSLDCRRRYSDSEDVSRVGVERNKGRKVYTGVLNRMLQLGVFYVFTACVHCFLLSRCSYVGFFQNGFFIVREVFSLCLCVVFLIIYSKT